MEKKKPNYVSKDRNFAVWEHLDENGNAFLKLKVFNGKVVDLIINE